MPRTYKDNIFFAICLCLPFLFVPQFLQLQFLGGPIGTELIVWPVLVMYGYTFCAVQNRNMRWFYFKYFISFIAIYFIFSVLALLQGLAVYPFWDLILNGPIDQIEKMPKVLSFLQIHQIDVSQKYLTEVWIVLRLIKNIVLDCFYLFFFSYVVYCLYRTNPERGIIILKNSITIILWIICCYSAFELLYFFGFDFGRQILAVVNPILHQIEAVFGWWPPLLWPGRVRSIFPEPSYFGMYAAFCVPFLCSNIMNCKKVKMNLIQLFCVSILVFLSLSKTSNILYLIAISLYLIYSVLQGNKCNMKKVLAIVCIVLISFFTSLLCINYYGVAETKSEAVVETKSEAVVETKSEAVVETKSDNISVSSYMDNNVLGAVNSSKGSNSARFSIIKSELKTFSQHPILGIGKGLGTAYNSYNLQDVQENIPEIKQCISLQKEKGILKTGFPTPSEYSRKLAEEGIIGTFIYFFPIFILMGLIMKKWRKLLKNSDERNNEVATYISLFTCLVSGASGILSVLQCYWLLLGLSYAYALYNGPDVKTTKNFLSVFRIKV